MIKTLFFTALFLIFISFKDSAFACTSFAVFSDHVFYGMNFDFATFAIKFLIITNGNMKTFHMAFKRTYGDVDFFANTVGMNTNGLFASCQEQFPHEETTLEFNDGDMYIFQLHDIINDLDSVDDIIKITDKTKIINVPGLNLHNLFADTTGNAIVAESRQDGNAVTRMQGKFMVMTNFANYSLDGKTYTEAKGEGADRYKISHEYILNSIHDFTIENGFELLKNACNHDPKYPTRCSMVFDPQKNNVYIALNRDYSKILKLSIENGFIEPWKGYKNDHLKSVFVGHEGLLVSDLIKY